MRSIIGLIYVVIGVFIAYKKDYFGNVDGIGDIINMLLAVLLWPLLLFGVKFNLHLGGGGDKDKALGALTLVPTYARRLLRSDAA